MRWLLGTESKLSFLPPGWSQEWSSRWEEEFNDSAVIYGGFLWEDVERFEDTLNSFHSQLCQDFQIGWTAVGLTARLGGKNPSLGPFAPPTTARPHESAPYGLYLLNGQRLLVSLTRALAAPAQPLDLSIHQQQAEFGPIFCDPNLEVSLLDQKRRNFHYRPAGPWQRFKRVGKALLGR